MPIRTAPSRIIVCLLAAIVTWGVGVCACAAGEVNRMVELTLQGRRIEGLPLFWDATVVHLLGRDGRLWEFDPADAANFKQTAAQFRSYSPSELRAALLREMGPGYEVSGTSHYLVVHPDSQRDRWAERFEDLYRSFVHYFGVRGFEPTAPAFPLVGIVCRDRSEFVRHAMQQDEQEARARNAAATGVLGYYEIDTNRINLYDMGAKVDTADWQQNASVLIHEATHQMAFNTGVHNRYCLPPTWVVEGLATLFEAPGVHNSHDATRPGDRINRGRFTTFRDSVMPRHRPTLLASIVATDELFKKNPNAAYAEAWALTFFLSETEPRKYGEYLKRTASRPAFRDYTAAERIADFTAVFGADWRLFEARFLRYMGGVK